MPVLYTLLLVVPAVIAMNDPAIKAGYGDVQRETIDGAVTVESGVLPKWLNGNFMRHACGVFGETDHMDLSEPNYISHLFDCMEIGSKFKLQDGKATFTNRWYDTVTNDIYNYYDRNMNESSVYQSTIYSKMNATQVDKWAANFSSSAKVGDVPHVSWWKIGNEAIAMTEVPIGVVIDVNDVSQKGYVKYFDDNLGIPDSPQYSFTNNPAHEQTDPDGTLWSAVSLLHFATQTQMKISRIVYKVGADRVRIPVGEYHYKDADLTRCKGDNPYPDMDSRFGYLHSFGMTKHYIILPEASYMHDPCAYTHYDRHVPFFLQGFSDETSGFSRLLVMRKSDGVFVANIPAIPFFVTHQFGAYEDGELIHMDMLMYNNAEIYTRYMYLDSVLSGEQYTTNASRVTINTTDWSYTIKNLRIGPPAAFEMSNINYAYYGRKYTYGYMIRNFDQQGQNAITKLNVDTGEELEYVLPMDMFVQEPQFVARPGAVFEDDGVLIAQGIDGVKQKAFMVVVNAKTMTLLSHVTAPDIAMFGIHERFFPFLEDATSNAISIISHMTLVVAIATYLTL